jgi:hypothetical protein
VQGQEQAETQKPAKRPPAALPKHRRGIYKDGSGIEVVDATPQSPPLETDDPGVPDKGDEINLTTDADLSKDVQRFDLLFVDANYGLLPKIAGTSCPPRWFEFPVAAVTGADSPFTAGMGAAKFGLKFSFFYDEHKGLSLAFSADRVRGGRERSVEKDLAEPGQTVILPLLMSKGFTTSRSSRTAR